jgi:hypothetical protein
MNSWNGIPLKGQANSGIIFAPENAPHYFDANSDLKVLYVIGDSRGVLPADPPVANQAPGFRRGSPRALPWLEPHMKSRDDGSVEVAGYGPDGKWYEATPEKVLTEAEKAAKAFHDAMADPSTLVNKAIATPDKAGKFAATVAAALNEFLS